jgi:RNA polymerase sigma-70 factor (ECF subfamily)
MDGDTEAFGEFYRRKRPRIYRIAARICGRSEAEDVTQAVFLRLWKVLPGIERLHRIDRWLHRATVNKSIDVLRHVHQRIKLVLEEEHDHGHAGVRQSFESGELSDVFNRAAEFLGPRQRSAFVLCEMEGFTSKETARIMRIKSSSVRNLVMQARLKLRTAFRELFPEYAPRD